MDEYTRATKAWLEERFRTVDADGVYVAHQPIYGLNAGHCEPAVLEKYVRTYHVVNALARIDFASLLDAGGAEGFKAHLVATLFGARVRACDLTEQACRRAREIFGIPADVADLHDLPYGEGAFDVVLCSESLEHVTDPWRALAELVRVARKAVVVTVPHEPEEVVERNVADGEPHAHIHHFDERSFDVARELGCRVLVRRIASPVLRLPAKLLPVRRHEDRGRYPRALLDVYNRAAPLLGRLAGEWAAAGVVRADGPVCRVAPGYEAVIAVLLKPGCTLSRGRRVAASRVVGCTVPLHRLERPR